MCTLGLSRSVGSTDSVVSVGLGGSTVSTGLVGSVGEMGPKSGLVGSVC